MNIRPKPGNPDLTIRSFPHLGPVSQEPISCHGDACARVLAGGLGAAKEGHAVSRRDVIIAAVEAHEPPLPRAAARLLAIMFAEQDVCAVSQEALRAEGFSKSLSRLLRALVDAGIVSKQAGASRVPDTYRLLLETRP
jgi:hypothetical protein